MRPSRLLKFTNRQIAWMLETHTSSKSIEKFTAALTDPRRVVRFNAVDMIKILINLSWKKGFSAFCLENKKWSQGIRSWHDSETKQ